MVKMLSCFDDLSKHAAAYEISLLLRRQEEKLIQEITFAFQTIRRACRQRKSWKWFFNCTPIIETQANDISAYINKHILCRWSII